MNLKNIRHIKVDYDKKTFCGHPRQAGGIYNFGNGELAVIYRRAPCKYETAQELGHNGPGSYKNNSDAVLRRSLDHGKTWLPENDVILFSNRWPMEKKDAFLSQDPSKRQNLDMSKPGAIFYVDAMDLADMDPVTKKTIHTTLKLETRGGFQIRSIDKGRTWESIPLPTWTGYPPMAALPNGSFAKLTGHSSHALHVSKDNGMSWQPLGKQDVGADPSGIGRSTYTGLIALPNGKLQCYMLMYNGLFHAIAMCESDETLTQWSEPRPIVRYGHGSRAKRPWTQETYAKRIQYGGWGQLYRAPWPYRMKDGRIMVIFNRREYPTSILAIVSEDDGKTWSDELVIRDEPTHTDMGYPVVTQLDDGSFFTAYYYQEEDGNKFGGTRFIAGSFFDLA